MTGLVVHEWIEQHGGSEKVLDAMVQAYPDADIACLWDNAPERYADRTVLESPLAKTPLRGRKAASLPFMHPVWRRTNIRPYDWVLVSSHAFAHHVGSRQARKEIPIYVYAHTPARYIWTPQLDSRGQTLPARIGAKALRRLDKRVAREGTLFAANSKFVQERIESTWEQPARVIYPPVDIESLQSNDNWADSTDSSEQAILDALPGDFILGASRFVAYKDLPRVIQVGEAVQLPVVLAGSGPELRLLQEKARQASVPVIFVDRPSDALLYALYQKSLAFVFPPVEDFGIMPVEAMALGTPVLVNAVGGATESAALTGGGVTLPTEKNEIVAAFDSAMNLDMEAARIKTQLFSNAAFTDNLHSWMNDTPKLHPSMAAKFLG